MSYVTLLPIDVWRLILPQVSVSDVGALARTCRAWRNLMCLVTSLCMPQYLLVPRTNPITIFSPSNRCRARLGCDTCSYTGTEANYGLCSACIRGRPHDEELIRLKTEWIANKAAEEDKAIKVRFTDRYGSSFNYCRLFSST